MKNFLMSAIALYTVAMMNGCDDTSINPQPPTSSTAENVIFYNQVGTDGQTLSVYRVNADGTGKVKIADNAAIWGHSFKNKIAYSKLVGNTTEIVVANADGTDAKTIKTVNETFVRSVLSPDGMKVMYYLDATQVNNEFTKIYCLNADGTGEILIADDAAERNKGIFSPDGNQIAFLKKEADQSDLGQKDSLFLINVNGTGRRFVAVGINALSSYDDAMSWSPDGKKIIGHYGDNEEGIGLITIDINSGTNFMTDKVGFKYFPVFSPDSKKLAYISGTGADNTLTAHLSVSNTDGSNQQNLVSSSTAPPFFPQWASDGNSILYTELSKGGNDPSYGPLKVINVNTSQTTTLDESAFKGYWKK